jgi:hypothetical protein
MSQLHIDCFLRHRIEIIGRVLELCLLLGINPVMKEGHLDTLATIAAIQTAVNALKASSTTPTTNFATPDVQSALTSLASSLSVTPVELATPPASGS